MAIFPKITGEIAIYGIGGSLIQLVGFVTIPFISRILDSTEFGTMDVITALTGYFLVIIPLHLGSGLMRFFFEVSDDAQKDRKKMVSSAIWFTTIFGAIVVGLVYIFSENLSIALFQKNDYAMAITLAVASLPFVALKELFASVLRMQRQPIKFLIINLFYAIISFFLTLWFLLGLDMGLNGYFSAQVISGFLITIISAWFCKDYLGLTFSTKWFGVMAAYALPMLPGGLLNQGMMSINRILLTQFTTESQIAYYSIATKTAKVVELIVTAFIMGWLPIFLANINSLSFHKKLDKVFRYYFYATLTLSAFVTIFAKEFFFILAPAEYLVGINLVALLCLKQVLTGSTYTFTVGITMKKKTYLVSIATALGVIATIGLSLLFSPRYGIFGAAIADAVGVAVYSGAMLVFSNNLVKLELRYKPVIWSILCFLVIWISTIVLQPEKYIIDLAVRLGLLILFLLIVFVVIDNKKILITIKERIASNFGKSIT
jgi:O-antigen/teichoic acid export membrane protein